MSLQILVIVILAYTFTFLNGVKDGGNVIATIITSRSLKPYKALFLAVIIEFFAPLFMGTAVAKTIGKGIVAEQFMMSQGDQVALLFLSCALVGAILWNGITWYFAIPSSSSHALVGGLIGSGIIFFGFNAINWSTVMFKVVLMIALTPILGFMFGWIVMVALKKIGLNFNPKFNEILKKSQLGSMFFLAVSHSTNDAQKSMGIITLLLVIVGEQSNFDVPLQVKIGSSFFLAFGMLCGGWKIVRTVGKKIYKLQPIHSLASQISSASVIFLSGMIGSPVSTSQIVSSSIVGIGSSERMSAVKWDVAKKIVVSWFITIPFAAAISAGTGFIVWMVMGGQV
jgi:PiT family inorganic phosphate transporter